MSNRLSPTAPQIVWPSSPQARADGTNPFLLVFMSLILLQLVGPGLEMLSVPGSSAGLKAVQATFMGAAVLYLFVNAGFYFLQAPVLLVGTVFLAVSFYATALFTDGNFIYASFELSKALAPYFAFLVLFREGSLHRRNLVLYAKAVLVACYVLAIVGLVLLPEIRNRGEEYGPAYFGGLHPSAYVVCMAGIGAFVLWLKGEMRKDLTLAMVVGSAAFIIVIWNVRTTIVLFFVFFAVYYWRVTKYLVLPGIILAVAAILTLLLVDSGKLSVATLIEFSSGRLSMWAVKLKMLADSSAIEFLFGRGFGSDYVKTTIWWWGAKDSHNDFLHVVTETGVFGLATIGTCIVAQRRVLGGENRVGTALLIAYISGSLFSNGLMFRPLGALIFGLVFAIAALPVAQGKVR